MGENIVGLLNSEQEAQAALRDLRSAGFAEEQVSLISKDPAAAAEAIERRELQADATTQDDAAVAVPQEQTAAMQPGGAYLIVRAHSEDQTQRAIDILNRYNVADIERRAAEYHEGNWAHIDEAATPETSAPQTQSRGA
jgi:hypothetical protein